METEKTNRRVLDVLPISARVLVTSRVGERVVLRAPATDPPPVAAGDRALVRVESRRVEAAENLRVLARGGSPDYERYLVPVTVLADPTEEECPACDGAEREWWVEVQR